MLDFLSEQCLRGSCRDGGEASLRLDCHQRTCSSCLLGPGYPAHDGSDQRSGVPENRSGHLESEAGWIDSTRGGIMVGYEKVYIDNKEIAVESAKN